MAADGCRRVVLLPVVLSSLWPCIMVSAQSLASVEVFFKDRRVAPTLLQGEVIEGSWADHTQRDGDPRGAELRPGSVEGNLRVVSTAFTPSASSRSSVTRLLIIPTHCPGPRPLLGPARLYKHYKEGGQSNK